MIHKLYNYDTIPDTIEPIDLSIEGYTYHLLIFTKEDEYISIETHKVKYDSYDGYVDIKTGRNPVDDKLTSVCFDDFLSWSLRYVS